MAVTDSLTTFGRQLVVGTGGARGNAGGRGSGRGKGGGFGLGGGNGGRGGGSSGPINPNQVTTATLIAWYDASDTTTITASSNQITEWRDKNGNSAYALSGSGGASLQPDSGTATRNSLNVVTFSGTEFVSNSTVSNWTLLHDSGGCTCFTVLRAGNVANPNTVYGIWGTNAGDSVNRGASLYYDDSGGNNDASSFYVSNGGSVFSVNGVYQNTMPANTWQLSAFRSNPAAAVADRSEFRLLDGTFAKTNTATGATSTNNSTFGFQVGSWGNGVFRLVGAIAEIVIYDGIMSTDEFNAVALGLKNKWNV